MIPRGITATHRQLVPLTKADYLIEVVCMTEPHFTGTVTLTGSFGQCSDSEVYEATS